MKPDVYQIVTDRVISLLEGGTVPWHRPWARVDALPQNLVSRKPYRGINPFLLSAMGYALPYWLTFKQAQELGGNVRKGEKSCPVVFWRWLEIEDKAKPGKKDQVPMLRYYNVFNVAQCEGIPESKIPVADGELNRRDHSPIVEAERIVAAMPKRPPIEHGRDRACYIPILDMVQMPDPETFEGGEFYYSVLFHELTHATGHESRLARKGISGESGDGGWNAFGSAPYAKEELVAEMGAAFLCGHAGIVERTVSNSAAYVVNWLERLRNDRKLVVQAAAQAQKAADFILGVQFEPAQEESEVAQ